MNELAQPPQFQDRGFLSSIKLAIANLLDSIFEDPDTEKLLNEALLIDDYLNFSVKRTHLSDKAILNEYISNCRKATFAESMKFINFNHAGNEFIWTECRIVSSREEPCQSNPGYKECEVLVRTPHVDWILLNFNMHPLKKKPEGLTGCFVHELNAREWLRTDQPAYLREFGGAGYK